MRGFQQQTVMIDGEKRPAMERFDCLSGLSGGNIPVMLYAFAQNVDANQLLDADYVIDDPSQITTRALNRKPRKTIFRAMTKSVTKNFLPWFLLYLPTSIMKSVWPLTLYYSLLKPFGIKRNKQFGAAGEKNVVSPRDEVKTEVFIS